MSMIFPGMDPYLEDARIWPGVHASMIVYIRDKLQPSLRPRYIAAIEERVFVEGPDHHIIPDVWLRENADRTNASAVIPVEEDTAVLVEVPELEIHETYITILDRTSGQRVVTVIEVVSPTNKYAGPGRKSYLEKQAQVCQSDVHLVQIDLLRTGPHVLAVPEWAARNHGPYDYLISVNRGTGARTRFELYPRNLRQRLPRIHIPLADKDPDVTLDLNSVLAQTYEAGCYADRHSYDAPCIPPLSPEDQAWADELIQAARQAS